MQRLPPRAYVQARAFELKVGQTLGLEAFRARLVEAGYASVSQVTSPGEFAVRGSLLDVFPMGSAEPLRIDLFDEEIEAIRRFDPDTQRSLDSLESVRLLPAREVPLDADAVKRIPPAVSHALRRRPDAHASIYRGVSEGLAPPGIEFYLPLFFEATATLFDYLPKNAVLVHDAALHGALTRDWQDIEARYEDRRHDIERPVLAPAELFVEPAELETAHGGVRLDLARDVQGGHRDRRCAPACATFRPPRRASCASMCARRSRSRRFDAFLREFGGRVLIAADSAGPPRSAARDAARAGPRGRRWCRAGMSSRSGNAPLALTVAPDVKGLTLTEPPHRGDLRSAAVR